MSTPLPHRMWYGLDGVTNFRTPPLQTSCNGYDNHLSTNKHPIAPQTHDDDINETQNTPTSGQSLQRSCRKDKQRVQPPPLLPRPILLPEGDPAPARGFRGEAGRSRRRRGCSWCLRRRSRLCGVHGEGSGGPVPQEGVRGTACL